jgi:hypothetical protein
MNQHRLKLELEVIRKALRPILHKEGSDAVDQALRDLADAQRRRSGKGRNQHPWQLTIPRGSPIRFIPTAGSHETGHAVWTDISCELSEPDAGKPSRKHNVLVRVWTDDEAFWFRQRFDATGLRAEVAQNGGSRVMLRFHFDYADPGQEGPKHHLQIGGSQYEGECCWYPDSLKVPRFVHHPVNVLLACEFVVRTFYPAFHQRMWDEPTWRGAIATAQKTYLAPYFKNQGITIDDSHWDTSLLGQLWNK